MIEEENDEIRQTTSYKRIRAYLLEHYDKGDIVFYDWQGRYQIFETVREKYSINESLPETFYRRICQLAMNDLVEKGIYSKLGDQYVRITENTIKHEEKKVTTNSKKKRPDRNKKFRQQQEESKIKARKEAKRNRHNIEKITDGFEH